MSYNEGTFYSTIVKQNINCEIVWTKQFSSSLLDVGQISTDESDNLYVIFSFGLDSNINNGPFSIGGLNFYKGLNLFKFDSSGNFIWS
uniref:hypothetical protein n=1 Tax=Flavobacterium sp. TaxID=239 RepID=UPI004048D94C